MMPARANDVGNGSQLRPSQYDVSSASSVEEILATLDDLSRREVSVTAHLNLLIASQKDITRELGRLDLLRGHLGSQVVNTRAVSNGMLSDAASTANRISRAVKRLDQEQSNIKATLQVVEQVAELKACVLGVHGSMGAPQDWETAAGYLSRASKISVEVVNGSFAEEMVPTAEVPDPPHVTLNTAAESLCGLFLREFENAAKEGDSSRVARFFKLFPLIGRSEVGLEAYGRYVCHGVASRARANFNSNAGVSLRRESYFYVNALTKLFEHIAQIIDGHQPLVERHYGAGMMIRVIERLQTEADIQGGIVLDTWHDERHIDRKLTDIKSYAFSFLVQSFLPSQKSNSAIPRSGSPAKKDGSESARESEDEGINLKEVDGLLSESALMLGRWSLYARFLASKCTVVEPTVHSDTDLPPLMLPSSLLSSNLQRKVSVLLIDTFNVMTTFFFRRSVERAFQLDEAPTDLTLSPSKPLGANPPFITSAVDDVMYIVNQVLQRSLVTAQWAVISSVVPDIGRVLATDFVGMIQRKMRDESYPKASIQGALPPEDKVVAFLVLMNNLDVANDYLKRIVESHIRREAISPPSSPSLTDFFPFGQDAILVENALKALALGFESKTIELINDSISVAFHQIMKPRIRPILAEAFRDADYMVKADDDNLLSLHDRPHSPEGAQEELVKIRFDRGWGALTRPIKRILTERNFDRLLSTSANYLSKALEKRIWSYYGRVSELGAVRLERDVAGVLNAAISSGRYSLRDAFARCTQMTLIMNMEEDEWEEAERGDENKQSESDVNWALDRSERQRARVIVKERT